MSSPDFASAARAATMHSSGTNGSISSALTTGMALGVVNGGLLVTPRRHGSGTVMSEMTSCVVHGRGTPAADALRDQRARRGRAFRTALAGRRSSSAVRRGTRRSTGTGRIEMRAATATRGPPRVARSCAGRPGPGAVGTAAVPWALVGGDRLRLGHGSTTSSGSGAAPRPRRSGDCRLGWTDGSARRRGVPGPRPSSARSSPRSVQISLLDATDHPGRYQSVHRRPLARAVAAARCSTRRRAQPGTGHRAPSRRGRPPAATPGRPTTARVTSAGGATRPCQVVSPATTSDADHQDELGPRVLLAAAGARCRWCRTDRPGRSPSGRARGRAMATAAASTMANRSSAGVSVLLALFCQGSLATTSSIRSSPSARRTRVGHLEVGGVDGVERPPEDPDAGASARHTSASRAARPPPERTPPSPPSWTTM